MKIFVIFFLFQSFLLVKVDSKPLIELLQILSQELSEIGGGDSLYSNNPSSNYPNSNYHQGSNYPGTI